MTTEALRAYLLPPPNYKSEVRKFKGSPGLPWRIGVRGYQLCLHIARWAYQRIVRARKCMLNRA